MSRTIPDLITKIARNTKSLTDGETSELEARLNRLVTRSEKLSDNFGKRGVEFQPSIMTVHNITLDTYDGFVASNPNTGKQTIRLESDGDAFFGSDLGEPESTSLSIFSNKQTYNSESFGAGDLLIGDNTSGKANLFWDSSAGRLNFRGGTTTYAYVDTDGTLYAQQASIGGWSVDSTRIYKTGIILDSSADAIYVGDPEGNYIIIDGGDNDIESSTYSPDVSGFRIDGNTGDAEFNNVSLRGSLTAVTFVYDNRHAISGTLVVAKSASTFTEDVTLNAVNVATPNCKINNTLGGASLFVLNDNLYTSFYNGTDITSGYMEVTSVGSNETDYTIYELTARTGNVGGRTIYADTTVINYGQTGDGVIGITGGSNATVIINEMTSTRTLTARLRFGDLNGVLGISSTTWGFATGDLSSGSKEYFKATGSSVELAGASFKAYDTSGNESFFISADDNQTWGSDTNVDKGDVVFGDPGTTSIMKWIRATGKLSFQDTSLDEQVYIGATDGTLYAGGGDFIVDSTGLTLIEGTASTSQIKWYDESSSSNVVTFYGQSNSSTASLTNYSKLTVTGNTYQNIVLTAGDALTIHSSLGSNLPRLNISSGVWSDPGVNNLYVDGYIQVPGGVHVGGTSDPGDDNLVVDGDLYTTVWTDYTASSTINGWSSTTVEEIYYKKVGKLVFVAFDIVGTSNSAATNFTVPFTCKNDPTTTNVCKGSMASEDNGGWDTGLYEVVRNTTTVNFYPVPGTATWTASGAKAIRGQLFYEAA